MDLNTSLGASFQKGVAIENSPQPGTEKKRGRDTTSPVEAYERKKVKTKSVHFTSLQEKHNQTTLIRQRSVEKVLHENDRKLLILSIQKVLSES